MENTWEGNKATKVKYRSNYYLSVVLLNLICTDKRNIIKFNIHLFTLTLSGCAKNVSQKFITQLFKFYYWIQLKQFR